MNKLTNLSIYLAGGMTGLSLSQQNEWREKAYELLHNIEESLIIWNPVDYYNDYNNTSDSDREIKDFDLFKVCHSDIILVNLNDYKSIGTSKELTVAKMNHIPIIGFCDNENLPLVHPWNKDDCLKICDSIEAAIEYIHSFLLN